MNFQTTLTKCNNSLMTPIRSFEIKMEGTEKRLTDKYKPMFPIYPRVQKLLASNVNTIVRLSVNKE